MTEAERKRRPCAACGKQVGLATIVCGGDFPDAPLCFECSRLDPFEEIPKMIRLARAAPKHDIHFSARDLKREDGGEVR
jgi:hypothetical protein